jgi:hypothetical protein
MMWTSLSASASRNRSALNGCGSMNESRPWNKSVTRSSDRPQGRHRFHRGERQVVTRHRLRPGPGVFRDLPRQLPCIDRLAAMRREKNSRPTSVRTRARSGCWAGGIGPADVQLRGTSATRDRPRRRRETTAVRALTLAWTQDGGQVIGLAPSAAAAAVLAEQTAIHTDTLAKLTWSLDHGDLPDWAAAIGRSTLLIIDEAGMADTLSLDAAVQFAVGRCASHD